LNTDRKQTGEEKKRKKKARQEFDALFKLIKQGCDRLKEFEETMKNVEKIKPLLERYGDILNAKMVKDIEDAIAKIDLINKRADQFCDLADRLHAMGGTLYDPAIPHWIQDLLPASGGGGLVVGVVTALVVVGAVITALSPLTSTSIQVTNQGCEPIQAPKGLPNIPGVILWKDPIPDGGTGTAAMPPFIPISVDASRPDSVGLSLFGIGPIPLPMVGVNSILLNGKEIKNTVVSVTTGIQVRFDLVITCR